ncbi:MAG: S8 family serine peptidase [Proteobacteria bacterium]|nr:S8 family serine peptidase [Pseudomonadota bacterium]
MMKIGMRTAMVAALFLCAMAAKAAAGEMDLMMRKMSGALAEGPKTSWSKSTSLERGFVLIPCFVRTRDAGSTAAAIEAAGGRAERLGGNSGAAIISAHVPAGFAAGLAARPEVEVVEAAPLLSPKMDTARTYSDTVAVQDGTGLGVAYDGTDVVVGAVDDGLDYGHPDFTSATGKRRVQYLMKTVNGTKVECKQAAIQDGTCGIADGGQGTHHGTHVTGIAAGNDPTYTGVAPNSDIMFVFNSATDASTSDAGATSFATAVLDGVSAIFAKADVVDKAAVVNLSLGTSIGAHDGTSLLEQGLTELSAAKPGRIIVNAAGNEQVTPAAQPAARRDYVGGIHASISAPAGESRGYRIGVWSGITAAATYVGGTTADVWLEKGQAGDCDVAAFAYTQGRDPLDFAFPGLATTDDSSFATADIPFSVDSSNVEAASDAAVAVSVDVDSSDIRNEKPHAMAIFYPKGGVLSSNLETRWFDVVIRSKGGACSGHMWLYFDQVYVHDFLKGMAGAGHDVGDGAWAGYKLADGDSLYTATIPSTAVGVISAGSWMPEKPVGSGVSEWTGDNGVTYDQSDLSAPGGTGSVTGDLSAFSSLGPTADGRTKPDIVAPGEPIIAALAEDAFVSNSVKVGGDHFKNAGTSMSSPHAAGVVALLLQRNNTLTVDQVRAALRTGATTAGMTAKSPDPENSFGAGKIDAVEVLKSAVEDTSAYSGTGDLNGQDGGSGGCGLVDAKGSQAAMPMALILCLALIVIPRGLKKVYKIQ